MNGYDHHHRDGTDDATQPAGRLAPGKRTLTQGIGARVPGTVAAPDSGALLAANAASIAPTDDPFGLHLLADSNATAPSPGAVAAAERAGLGDVSGVRLHTDAHAQAAADAHAARAFTVGPDVYFGAGEFQPGTRDGDRLLGHELAHARQQRHAATATTAAKLRSSEPGDAAEIEADRAGDAFAAWLAGEAVAPVALTAAPLAIARTPIGQSHPLDPFGQSRPLDPLGQSFADESRDADHDGRADLVRQQAGSAHGAPPQPSRHAAQLAAAIEAAIADVNLIPATLLPAYAEARDALDAAALQALAVDILTKYQAAIDVRDQVRPIVDANDPGHAAHEVLPATPERAADRGALLPLWGALEAALTVAESRLATDLGPTHFQGREVAAGVAPVRIGRTAGFTVPRLLREAINTGELVAAVAEIRDLLPGAALATVGEATAAIDPDTSRAIVDRITPFASRPVHFAFIKAALGSLGLWVQVEHATGSDGRSLAQVDDAATAQAARFGAGADLGAYNADQILALLKPKNTGPNETTYTVTESNAARVIDAISAIEDPQGRAAVLRDLDAHGLLDSIASLAAPAPLGRLHDSLPSGAGHVQAIMRPYFQGRDTTDHSLSSLLESVPGVGGILQSVTNIATFGFLDEHDAAYRAMRAGEITEAEYQHLMGKALLRAGVVGVASYATGGAAGAYAEGLTGSLAARGVVGRVAANTITGAAAGSAGAVGARLGSDAVDGRLSSAGDLAHDALLGGAVGGGLGAGLTTVGAAAARYLPPGAQTWLQRFAARFPHESEIFDRFREAGQAHGVAIRIKVARLLQVGEELELANARGMLAIASADGGPPLGPDDEVIATFKATRALDDETTATVDGPAPIAVLKVERLPEESVSTPGDDAASSATGATAEPAASARDFAEPSPATTADATRATTSADAEIATAPHAAAAAARARVVQAVGDVPIGSLPSSKGRPSYFITRADGATLRSLLAQLDEVRVIEFPRGLTIHRNGRDWFLEWAPESGACAPAYAGARDAATVGLPPPNASLVLFYGFRGLKNVDGVYWRNLPPDKLAHVEHWFHEDQLLHYGHVGVSFDGGRTIYGLTPPIDGTPTLTAAEVVERVKAHVPVPGIIGDDTMTFRRAMERGSADGWDLEITTAAISLDEAARTAAFGENARLASTPYEEHGRRYQWPYDEPNAAGEFYPDDVTRNCATYPEMIGLGVPEQSGQLRDYIPELKAWADVSPVDQRSEVTP